MRCIGVGYRAGSEDLVERAALADLDTLVALNALLNLDAFIDLDARAVAAKLNLFGVCRLRD